MENLYEYRRKVESRDVDFMRRMKVSSLLDYLLGVAGDDADNLGFGSRDLKFTNGGWVLLRICVEITRLPDELENVTFNTWVSDFNRLSTSRNIEMRGADGEIIVKAITIWALLNIESRKTINLDELTIYQDAIKGVLLPIEPPARLSTPENVKSFEHKVCYSDVDYNRHTHSINYVKWVFDTLSLEQLKSDKNIRLDINFVRETYYDDTLSIISNNEPNPLFEIVNPEGKPACRIAIKWH